jgi:hypothetical protein
MNNLHGKNSIHINAETMRSIIDTWFQGSSNTYDKNRKTTIVDVSYVVESDTYILTTSTEFTGPSASPPTASEVLEGF